MFYHFISNPWAHSQIHLYPPILSQTQSYPPILSQIHSYAPILSQTQSYAPTILSQLLLSCGWNKAGDSGYRVSLNRETFLIFVEHMLSIVHMLLIDHPVLRKEFGSISGVWSWFSPCWGLQLEEQQVQRDICTTKVVEEDGWMQDGYS